MNTYLNYYSKIAKIYSKWINLPNIKFTRSLESFLENEAFKYSLNEIQEFKNGMLVEKYSGVIIHKFDSMRNGFYWNEQAREIIDIHIRKRLLELWKR